MNKFTLIPTSQFRKDFKKYSDRTKEKSAVIQVLELLAEDGHKAIPQQMKPHTLKGKYNKYWECHAMPDLLLVWNETETEIYLIRLGSHSDIF